MCLSWIRTPMEEVLSLDLGKFVLPSSELSLVWELRVFIAIDVLEGRTERRTENGKESTLYKCLSLFIVVLVCEMPVCLSGFSTAQMLQLLGLCVLCCVSLVSCV